MTDILTKFRYHFNWIDDKGNICNEDNDTEEGGLKAIEDFLTEALIQVRKDTLSEVKKIAEGVRESWGYMDSTDDTNMAIDDILAKLEELKK